jgi:hypothetical protein
MLKEPSTIKDSKNLVVLNREKDKAALRVLQQRLLAYIH